MANKKKSSKANWPFGKKAGKKKTGKKKRKSNKKKRKGGPRGGTPVSAFVVARDAKKRLAGFKKITVAEFKKVVG